MRLVPIAILALALVACGTAGTDPTEEPTATLTAEPTAEPTPDATASPSPDEKSPRPTVEAAMTITGRIGGDDIEGGCPFVEAEDGTVYEVIWPEGWSLEFATLELVNPEGEVVAEGGDEVTVHGDVAQGMGSICQIGQIFEAVDVEVDE